MTERVVPAYSGGLDTSVALGWIAGGTGADVVAAAVDAGPSLSKGVIEIFGRSGKIAARRDLAL